MHLFVSFLTLFVLFILSSFFSATETALFSLSKIERRRLTEKHPTLAKWVQYHLDHPRRTLITILIGNMLVNTFAASTVTFIAFHYGGPSWISFALTIFTVLLIFFGEIIPKTLAVKQNENFSAWAAIPLHVVAILLYPLRLAVRRATDHILKFIIGEPKERLDQITEEELRMLVKIGEEEGVLDRQERYMLQKLLDLGERPVKEIMTPRISVVSLNIEDPRAEHVQLMKKYHFAHFPVYHETPDHILGVVSVAEYMLRPELDIRVLLHQPLFVPELKRIDDLLAEFRQKNQTFAICVDEYGGTAGVATLEDIFEEIFGEFYDEYAKVENPIRPLGHGEFLVEAKIPLTQFNEHFGSKLESEAATTLGGFIMEKLGVVPEKDAVVDTPECELHVQDVIRQRVIRSVLVKKKVTRD